MGMASSASRRQLTVVQRLSPPMSRAMLYWWRHDQRHQPCLQESYKGRDGLSEYFYQWNWNITGKLGHCHSYWSPGSLHCQVNLSNAIDYTLQSSRMNFTLRLPIGRRKHQMIIILTNPTSDIWILRLTWLTCWRDFVKTELLWTAKYKWWDIHKCRVALCQKIHYVQAWTQM